jgi:hypothetical protein
MKDAALMRNMAAANMRGNPADHQHRQPAQRPAVSAGDPIILQFASSLARLDVSDQ